MSVPVSPGEPNGHVANERLTHSLPGSPADRRPPPFEVVGSAESLVGRILVQQGLGINRESVNYLPYPTLIVAGKFCDPDFVRNTSKEMQEALDMTQEEMDRAAHELLQHERQLKSRGGQSSPVEGPIPSPQL